MTSQHMRICLDEQLREKLLVQYVVQAKEKENYVFQIVNLNKEIFKDEKFMFISQVEQCFYIKNSMKPDA